MRKVTIRRRRRSSQAGITMIETLLASAILVIGSLGMIGVVIGSIASNNRNKIDSTQTMLATSILEQINSTLVGSGTSDLKDCAGNNWIINTAAAPSSGFTSGTTTGGVNLNGAGVDFTQDISAWSQSDANQQYYMSYVLSTPCNPNTGIVAGTVVQGTYDVRWHVDQIAGSGTGEGATSTYLLTVGARLAKHGEGNKYFSAPVTLRMLSGDP